MNKENLLISINNEINQNLSQINVEMNLDFLDSEPMDSI